MEKIIRKLVLLCVATAVLTLCAFPSEIISAQEPTQEPDAPPVVVVEEGEDQPIPAPAGGVVVVPTGEGTNTGWLTTLSTVLLGVVALASILSNYLTTAQRQKFLQYGEMGEAAAWNVALSTSQVIKALGGRPDVLVSDDPAIIAAALRAGETNIFIKSGADVSAIITAYNNTPATPATT